MRGTFRPLRSSLRPRARGSLSARRCPRPVLAPGSAGRSPSGSPPAPWLRLSGRAAPASSGRSVPPPPSLRLRLRPPAAWARSLRPRSAARPPPARALPSLRCVLACAREAARCAGAPLPRPGLRRRVGSASLSLLRSAARRPCRLRPGCAALALGAPRRGPGRGCAPLWRPPAPGGRGLGCSAPAGAGKPPGRKAWGRG